MSLAVRQVQTKLNRLSLYVLGTILAKCKDDDFGSVLRLQVLAAMAPELDARRLDDQSSFDLLKELGEPKWNEC